MRIRMIAGILVTALALLVGTAAVRSDAVSPNVRPSVARARQIAQRGLEFLRKDAAEWRTTRKCASCHQGTMTVWALAEAKNQGYPIPAGALTDAADWNRERLVGLDKPRDGDPGTKTINSAALFTGLIAATVPRQDAVTAADLERIVDHLRRYQEADGAWLWSPTPAKNRPPPVFESDELATVLSDLVLAAYDSSNPQRHAVRRDSREHAAAWLDKHGATETIQVQAFQLLREVQARKPRKEIGTRVARLLNAQRKDGGWSPEEDVPSDAYATGQVLYFLSFAGVKPERPEIQRAISFLALNQQPDGSWFVAPRAHPGEKPFSNPSPISYFGTAWTTMGLMRMAPLVPRSKH